MVVLFVSKTRQIEAGGTCYEQTVLDEIAEISKAKNCGTHIDGARIFNASVATKTPLHRMTRDYDSVSICLSKGLGAPVGSVLVGSDEFIEEAHWMAENVWWGGMRQSGILAAAGIYALENNIQRIGGRPSSRNNNCKSH